MFTMKHSLLWGYSTDIPVHSAAVTCSKGHVSRNHQSTGLHWHTEATQSVFHLNNFVLTFCEILKFNVVFQKFFCVVDR